MGPDVHSSCFLFKCYPHVKTTHSIIHLGRSLGSVSFLKWPHWRNLPFLLFNINLASLIVFLRMCGQSWLVEYGLWPVSLVTNRKFIISSCFINTENFQSKRPICLAKWQDSMLVFLNYKSLFFDNCGTLGIIPILHLPSAGMTLENAAINDPSYSDPTPSAFNQLHHRAKKWVLSSAGFFFFGQNWAQGSS